MYRYFFSLTLMLISSVLAMAQDVQVTMTGPSSVAVGRPFNLKIAVNSQSARLGKPQLSDFDVLGQSSGTSMSFINGNMTVERSVTYTMVAVKPGTFTIPGVEAEADGKKYTSKSLTIEVTGEAEQNQASNQAQDRNSGVADNVQSSGEDVFLDVTCNKKEVYTGEQLIMTCTLFSAYNVSDFEDFKVPSFNGFWVKDVENPKNITFDRKRIGNKTYLYAMLQKKALFPQRAGTLTIEPYKLDLIVGDGFFRTARASAKSKTREITVKPLPEGKPQGFSGAVGNFKISLQSDKTEVKLDDPLTLKITVTGSGNFQLFDAPKLNLNSAFEQFEPKSTENITVGAQGVSGSKTFSTVVIARQPGDYVIEPVKFSFFDPASKSYKTVETQELKITVTGERDPNSQSTGTAIIGSEVEDLASDIRFIKQDNIKLKNGNDKFFNTIYFWLIFILLPVLLAGAVMFRMQQIKNNANVLGMRRSKAGKTSRKRLKKAESFIKDNKKDDFYVEILNALWGYLSDKLSIPVSMLNRDNVQENLAQKNIDQAVTDKFINVLDTCEFEHYAPESMSHSLQEVYDMAAEAIEQMETSIKA